MNISQPEQRTLHVLAQGGRIAHTRGKQGKIEKIICFTRDGLVLSDCTLDIFKRLRSKRLIGSENGGPYRINSKGLKAVRSQADNR